MAKSVAFYLADQNPHRDRSLGITTITKTLMSGMVDRPGYELAQVVSQSSFAFENQQVKQHLLPWATDQGKVKRVFTDNLHPYFLRSIKPDIWFYPKGYISYVARPNHGLVVSMMHDTLIQHYADKYPEARSKLDLTYWLGLLKASIRRSDHILTVSQSAKQQLTDFCTRYHIPVPDIHVTYEASDFQYLDPGDPRQKQDYVIHLASQHPYKKTLEMLQYWEQLLTAGRDLPQMHLVGTYTPEVKALANRVDGIVMKPRMDFEDFVDEIRQAKALIFPSEFEGFGLPAIEGYFLNTPVVYVNGTSVAEVLAHDTRVGGYDLDDSEGFEKALTDVLELSPEEIEASNRGLRERYSKEKYLNAVDSVLRTIN
jgi:glycosyltransferase involved in cell wall biosynthesis